MLIDFEFADYNFRAFDLANHLVEYMYDYTNEEFPFYNKFTQNFPSKERQVRNLAKWPEVLAHYCARK